MKTGEPIRIDELPIDGLEHLRQQLQTVLEAKKKGIEILANTAGAFDQSRSAIEDLSKLKDGDKMMVPLTESLYVEGFVHEKDRILVDIGTGYYAERSCEQAMNFCERKITIMRTQIDEVGEDIKQKEGGLQQVEALLQDRMAEAKAQEKAAASADALALS